MSRRRDVTAALLRWYPDSWRERYGEELVALIEDGLGDQPPTSKLKVSIARAGLRERVHQTGLIGDHPSPAERTRAGSLLVLCAWTAFVLAGASFSKASEHFAQAMPAASRTLPQDAFNVIAALGVIGAALVVLGALAALPAFVRFVRSGGWSFIGRHVLRATALTVVTVGAVIPLSLWAHHLNAFQRNGGDGIYSGAFGIWALFVAATLAQWTAAGVAAARRIDLARRVLYLEAVLAFTVAGAMAVMTVSTALWWGAMAKNAPWFLQGTATGSKPSPFNTQLLLTMALMLIAVLISGYGVIRVGRSWTALRAA